MSKFFSIFRYVGYTITNEETGLYVKAIITSRDYLCRTPKVTYADFLEDACVFPDDVVEFALRYLSLYYGKEGNRD